jgi:hypothetical protein
MTTNNITINVKDILNKATDDFIVKKYTFNNNEYMIIKYNKEKLKQYEQLEDETKFHNNSLYRSVIVRNNRVVCYSPGKSHEYNKFKNENNNLDQCWVEDFIEGTMVNVFYDNVNEIWEIATKSTVGGNIVFFNDVKNYKYLDVNNVFYDNCHNATFRTMFFEACNSSNFDLNTLDRRYTYSFVMQHPLNRIVSNIVEPMVFLVKIYEIDNSTFETGNIHIKELNPQYFISNPPYIFLNTTVKFVNKYPLSSYTDIENYYNSNATPFNYVGCMVLNINGVRTKIRNKNYEAVRKLRGNQPKLQYHYLCLKQENKVKEFLQYYPEHTFLFNSFKLQVYSYTSELFINYISCFIRKEKPLKEYEFQYKNHMYKLHEKFKTELKPNNKTIDKKCVIDYVNNLHPAQQLFIINYENRNKNTNKNDFDSKDNENSNEETEIISNNQVTMSNNEPETSEPTMVY